MLRRVAFHAGSSDKDVDCLFEIGKKCKKCFVDRMCFDNAYQNVVGKIHKCQRLPDIWRTCCRILHASSARSTAGAAIVAAATTSPAARSSASTPCARKHGFQSKMLWRLDSYILHQHNPLYTISRCSQVEYSLIVTVSKVQGDGVTCSLQFFNRDFMWGWCGTCLFSYLINTQK